MLFDATLAVSRTAYCLGQKSRPNEDPFVLQHKIQALSKLRNELQSLPVVPSEAVIFTVSRMLSVSYMTLDSVSFEAHFAALQHIAQRYMLHKSADDEMARVVESRLKAWTPLFEYRQSQNPLVPVVQRLALGNTRVNYPPASLSDELYAEITVLPRVFSQLAARGVLCIELIRVLVALKQLLGMVDHEHGSTENLPIQHDSLTNIREQIIALLASLELSVFETQLCHALLGFAMSISIVYPSTEHQVGVQSRSVSSTLASDPPLERIAKAFLYLKYMGADLSPEHNLCLQWAALALGSCCFLVNEPEPHVRQKGHITLISITERLLPKGTDDEWEELSSGLRHDFFWPEGLVWEWRRIYVAAICRQHEWEGLGLLRIGMPSTDKIEYMVLRQVNPRSVAV
jgi:hypothetical protein